MKKLINCLKVGSAVLAGTLVGIWTAFAWYLMLGLVLAITLHYLTGITLPFIAVSAAIFLTAELLKLFSGCWHRGAQIVRDAAEQKKAQQLSQFAMANPAAAESLLGLHLVNPGQQKTDEPVTGNTGLYL